ncbi:hypothetical protein [Mesorhizobium sp. Root172]|uniref:hypothetical protein n=1 Tax=Mesorhizobium sp. Root172 TaxID=1736481 RepID=UPI000A4C3292|nr:hypothetical protein [Mesorhizobium sp. Root172]
MINVTRFDGEKFQMKATDIIRVRQTTLNDGPNGKSRIDDAVYETNLYNDLAKDVATATSVEVKTFISLTQPGGQPVWFDGAKAKGPTFVSDAQKTPDWIGKINSALKIGGKVQYVKNTPQEVYDAIKAQGGVAIPPINNNWNDVPPDVDGNGKPLEVWDAGLYRSTGV